VKDFYFYKSLLLTMTVLVFLLCGLLALVVICGIKALLIIIGFIFILLLYFYGGFRKPEVYR
jgi:hypothetical protein